MYKKHIIESEKRVNNNLKKLTEALKERGLLCKETHDTVIRFAPPLIIEKEDFDWAIEQIKDVLSK